MEEGRMKDARFPGGVPIASLAFAMAFAAILSPVSAQTRDPAAKLTPAQQAQMLHRHVGQAGALDPANLAKKRPKPPFDMTGTWFIDLSAGFNKFMFGPPYPEFYEEGKKALEDGRATRAKGQNY